MNGSPAKLERCSSALKSWCEIHISRDDSSVEQRIHAVLNVLLGDWRRLTEGIVTELFGQNALCLVSLFLAALANAELLKRNVAQSTLTSAIFDLIWWSQAELVPDHVMTNRVLRVSCKEGVLLLFHLLANRLVD